MITSETELDLYRIISGKLIFIFNNKEYELRAPSPAQKYQANIIYKNIINDEKYNEWMRAEYLENYMISLGIWDREMSSFLKKSEKVIDDYKVQLYNSRFTTKQADKIRKQLSSLRDKLVTLHDKKQQFYVNTLEGYAEGIKHEYLITNTVYCDNKLVFKDPTSTQTSYLEFTGLLSEINKHFISTATYRKIARSDLWKSYWGVAKYKVFNNAICEWTDEQRSLVSFSAMYDSVYEHPEKPTDSIINDDDMLDGWMIMQQRNAEKERQQKEITSKNDNLAKAQEVFIFTDSSEGAEQVMELNSDESMAIVQERFKTITKVGEVQHQSLPDIKETYFKQ